METLIERLAKKNQPQKAPELTVLPLLEKEHEGECGDGCGCGDESGGCCGG